MNILLIDFWKVVASSGGAEKVLCNMANELVKRNHRVAVVCNDPDAGKPFFFLDKKVQFINLNGTGKEYKVNIISVIEREILRIFGRLDKEKFYIKIRCNENAKSQLEKTIFEFQPNIIITFDPDSLTYLEQIIKPQIPVIAMLHLSAKSFFKNNMSKTLLEAFNKAAYIQTLSEKDIAVIKKFLPNAKIVYIPNCVSISDRPNDRMSNNILCIGRLDKKQKRQLILVEAFNLCKNRLQTTGWTLELVGGTRSNEQKNYKNEILQYIKREGLERQVKLSGETKNISEKLNQAGIFAFPSSNEGMPLALIEAMAAGLPAVGYKSCPSVNELIIDGYNGFLCEDGINDFAEKLQILMSDLELRKKMGNNARETMKKFAPEKIWNQWELLINKVIKE